MGDGGLGSSENEGISDKEAAEFAESQGAIGLGTLGLTAEQLAQETAKGVEAAYESQGIETNFPGGAKKEPKGKGQTGDIASEKTSEEKSKKEPSPSEIREKEQKAARKKRRRSLLGIEEEGLLEPAPVKRRSLLGIP